METLFLASKQNIFPTQFTQCCQLLSCDFGLKADNVDAPQYKSKLLCGHMGL